LNFHFAREVANAVWVDAEEACEQLEAMGIKARDNVN
jgi:hypothetical protein